jgi:hypothetical protein
MFIKLLKCAQDAPKDSFSFSLKVRTSIQRLTTLEMGKKDKQNLFHNIFQSPCILSTVCLYHCLAIPIKENENNFHLKVSLAMLAMCRHALVCSNSRRCKYEFSLHSPKKDCSRIIFMKHGRSS